MDMDKYSMFEKKVERGTIDEVDKMSCPNCGEYALYFTEGPDETYMNDGTFIRDELVCCGNCNLQIEVVQYYKPTKCRICEIIDEFCETEDEEEA